MKTIPHEYQTVEHLLADSGYQAVKDNKALRQLGDLEIGASNSVLEPAGLMTLVAASNALGVNFVIEVFASDPSPTVRQIFEVVNTHLHDQSPAKFDLQMSLAIYLIRFIFPVSGNRRHAREKAARHCIDRQEQWTPEFSALLHEILFVDRLIDQPFICYRRF